MTAHQPALILGSPGIGKSDIVASVADVLYAADHGLTFDGYRLRDANGQPTDERPYLVDLRVSLMDPVDLMGLPTIVDGVQTFARPEWFPTTGRGILFLDEITRGSVMVQNALLQLTLNRQLGRHVLPAGWDIVAASNRLTDGGGVVKMPAALNERFVRLNLKADHDEWVRWAVSNDVHPLIIAFTKWKPDLFCQQAPNEDTGTNPRSWAFASNILKHQPGPNVELMLMAGTLGVGVAGEVMAFVRNFRSCPSIDSIIADPHNAPVPGRTEPSSLFAIASALSRRVDDQNAEVRWHLPGTDADRIRRLSLGKTRYSATPDSLTPWRTSAGRPITPKSPSRSVRRYSTDHGPSPLRVMARCLVTTSQPEPSYPPN